MKILYLVPADFCGGAEIFAIEIAEKISQYTEIKIVTSGKSENFIKKISPKVSLEITNFPAISAKKFWNFFIGWRNLKKILKKFPADIILANSVRTALLANFSQKKWFFFAHDNTFPKMFAKNILKNSQKIFTVSDFISHDLQQKGIFENKICQIYNGIYPEKFTEIKQKKIKKKLKIGLIGRIDWWKGQDIFVLAAEKLQKKIPEAQFLIFGKSNKYDPKTQEFEKKLQKIILEKKIKNVFFRGFEKIEKILSEIDLLVHCSTKPEPFGRTILEAAAAGIPIISTDLPGGGKEILPKKFSKFLISPNNRQKLAQKIIEIHNSFPKVSEQFFLEREKIWKKFSIEKLVQKIWQEIAK